MADVYQKNMTAKVLAQTRKHPCYSSGACRRYARLHLPVAPHCNIQCNYCNRKFDCVNESRPGVTSEVLTPELAAQKFAWVKREIPELSVVGIAGPGDALADWSITKAAIRQIKEIDPDIVFCLSTNGLLLPHYANEIIDLDLHHVTVTVNALDPVISSQIYHYVSYQGKNYTGGEAATLLLQNQTAGIEYLARHGGLVKVNIVMVPGINDRHIPAVVKRVKELGAFVTNIMPLIPAPGSAFENFPQTSMKAVTELQNICQPIIQQMRHCQQCRADAVGKLAEDRAGEFRMNRCPAADTQLANLGGRRYKIAVTSKHGKLVDMHFGQASEFTIYQGDGQMFKKLATRSVAGKYCAGMAECDGREFSRDNIIKTLKDCDAILTMRIGRQAKEHLQQNGIRSVEFCDSVENGLRYAVEQIARPPSLVNNGEPAL